MPYFLMLGVDEEKFWESTAKELEPYRKMDEMQQKRLDYNMWMMGAYITNAVGVAVSGALAGKKSKAKYLEKPLSQTVAEKEHRNPKQDFAKFSAWAVVYNEQFTRRNR